MLFASVSLANIGQKGREKHHDLNDAVKRDRAEKSVAAAEARATGTPQVQKCPDLVIKKGKRTTVIQCGNPKRDNPSCPVCGITS